MRREDHLRYCQICNHRKVDFEKGIVCGFTNQIADFTDTCPSFEENAQLKQELQEKIQAAELENSIAGFSSRLANHMIDNIFVNFIVLALAWFLFNFSPSILEKLTIIDGFIIYMGFRIGYYTLMEGITGRTIGKMVTNTKVVNEKGEKPGFGMALVRSLCRLIPFEPFSFLGNDVSGWHDQASNTIVVKN